MTSLVERRNITIDQNWLEANRNDKYEQTASERIIDYCGTSYGTVCALQGVQKSLKLGNEIGHLVGYPPTNSSEELVRDLGIATSAMGIARIPKVTSEAIKSLSAIGDEKDPTDIDRKVENAVKDTTGAISTYVRAGTFITKNSGLLAVASAAELVTHVTDLHLSVVDYGRAAELEPIAKGQVKEAVTHSKNYYLFRIIKAIMSVVSAILGLALLMTGFPFLPALSLIILSLATTIITIVRDNYKNMGQFNVIKFNRPITLV